MMNATQARKELEHIVFKLKELELMIGSANPQVMKDIGAGLDEESKKLTELATSLKK